MISPFQNISDVERRRKAEGIARQAASLLSGMLLLHGTISQGQSMQVIDVLTALLLFAWNIYQSNLDKSHTEKVIAIAQAGPPDVPRATLDQQAKDLP